MTSCAQEAAVRHMFGLICDSIYNNLVTVANLLFENDFITIQNCTDAVTENSRGQANKLMSVVLRKIKHRPDVYYPKFIAVLKIAGLEEEIDILEEQLVLEKHVSLTDISLRDKLEEQLVNKERKVVSDKVAEEQLVSKEKQISLSDKAIEELPVSKGKQVSLSDKVVEEQLVNKERQVSLRDKAVEERKEKQVMLSLRDDVKEQLLSKEKQVSLRDMALEKHKERQVSLRDKVLLIFSKERLVSLRDKVLFSKERRVILRDKANRQLATEDTFLGDEPDSPKEHFATGLGDSQLLAKENDQRRIQVLCYKAGFFVWLFLVVILISYPIFFSKQANLPLIIQSPQDQIAITTRSVTFSCTLLNVVGNDDSIEWTFNSNIITGTTRYAVFKTWNANEQTSYLTIKYVQYSDRGVYQCTAANSVGSVSKSATLTVDVTPIVYKVSSPLSVNITNSTSLCCVAVGSTISWLNNGASYTSSNKVLKVITSSTKGKSISSIREDCSLTELPSSDSLPLLKKLEVLIVVFNGVKREDTASYTCVASSTDSLNRVVIDYSSTELIVQERPDPPRNVAVMTMTSRSVCLQWELPFNGNLHTWYKIYMYQSDLDGTMNQPKTDPDYRTNQQHLNITSGITPYTKYIFTIEACNLMGCSGQNHSKSIRTNTAAPSSPPRDCNVTTISSTSLQTSWAPPVQPNGPIVRYAVSYRPLYSLSGLHLLSAHSVTRVTSDNSTQLVLSQLLKGTSYSIMLTAYTVVGPGPSSTDQCTTYTLEDAPDGPPLNLVVNSDTSSSLIVTWTPPDLALQNGIITHHYVTYSSARSGRQLTVNTTDLRAELRGLDIFTDYNVTVASGTTIGLGPYVHKLFKTLNDTSGPPDRLTATVMSTREVLVQWNAPLVSNGDITNYKVYFYPFKSKSVSDLSYDLSQHQVEVAGNKILLTGLQTDTWYTIYVTAFNGAGEGNRSATVVLSIPLSSCFIVSDVVRKIIIGFICLVIVLQVVIVTVAIACCKRKS